MTRKADSELREERRRQILDAALTCFRREGFRGASIADICAEARMSPGHLYHYFPGKEAIIEAIAERDLERGLDIMARAAERPDFVEALISLGLEEHATRLGLCGALRTEIAAEATRNPRIAAMLRSFHRRLEERLADILAEAQRAGQIKGGLDASSLAVLLIQLSDGFHARLASDPEFGEPGRLALHGETLRLLLTGRPPARSSG